MHRFSALAIPAALAVALAAIPHPADADGGPLGLWDREDGLGGVRFERCGEALCGFIAWLKEPKGPGRIGERVFFDLRPSAADTWAGEAHNPEDGQDYAGTIRLDGARLVAKGCVFGGLICKTVVMLRPR